MRPPRSVFKADGIASAWLNAVEAASMLDLVGMIFVLEPALMAERPLPFPKTLLLSIESRQLPFVSILFWCVTETASWTGRVFILCTGLTAVVVGRIFSVFFSEFAREPLPTATPVSPYPDS